MTIFGGFITGGTVSTDPGDATRLIFSGIVINGAGGAVPGDTFSAGGYQVPIASIDGTGAATLVYAFPVALDGEADYAIARDSAERYNPAATNLLVRQYFSRVGDPGITYTVPDNADGPDEQIISDPQEGQKAIRYLPLPWTTWLYTEGAWVEQPGAPGGPGPEGPVAWLPPVAWATETEYTVGPPASLVTHGGESYVCLEDHESDDFYTDLAAGKWLKVAAKGADGTGTGDVTGPSSSTDAHIVLFDGATGKAIKDSGVTLDEITGDVAGETHAAGSKTAPVDADEIPLVDSAASWGLKKLTWANLKVAITSIFGTAATKDVGTSADNIPQLDSGGHLLNAVMGGSSIGASGYYTLPGGLIVQYGRVTITSGEMSIAFPTSFPTACATVDVTFSQPAAPASTALACVIPHTITKSGCSASCRYSLNGGTVAPQSTGFIEWIAIGY